MPEAVLTLDEVKGVLDEAAVAAGMPTFERHPHFVRDGISHEMYRRYRLRPPSAAYVALDVEVSADGLSLHVDRVPEALEWGTKHLADRERAVRALSDFFSGYLVVEHRSRRATRLTLYGPSGEQVWSFRHTQWPGVASAYERRLFLPLNTMPPAA